MIEMFQELKDPSSSTELQTLLSEIYGDQVTSEMFIDATLDNKDAKISLILLEEQICGYIIWLLEKEVEADEDTGKKTTTTILAIDEIVIRTSDHKKEMAEEIIKGIEGLVKKHKCSIVEIALPSQTFWLILALTSDGGFRVAILRVSKELERKTEFVGIYNKVQEEPKPEIIELMISKEDVFQLELIEEPTDYKKIIESGYNPEIVSMIFNVDENTGEELLNKVNEIAEWQEYSFSLIKYYEE
ncbi:MAG: hypothetical protein ACTSQF_07450 [Candidatus Heimdallarchaeaceae archaeon]